jgi:alginate production protein
MNPGVFRPLAIAAAMASMSVSAQDLAPGEASFGIKLKLAGLAEGDRGLGTREIDGTPLDIDGETAEGYLDVQPVLFWRMAEDWDLFVRLQGFVPSGEVVVFDEERPRRTESFAAVREAWIAYHGLTSYPGEMIKLGRQRLREADGTWWDRDAEALRWTFDSTLLQAHVGLASELHTARTGSEELPASQRDRGYGFAGVSRQWYAEHFIGARVAHAFDYADPEDDFGSSEPDPKLSKRNYTWIGVYAHNDYFGAAERAGLYYWTQYDLLLGDREDLVVGADPALPATTTERDVRSWAIDGGARLRFAAPLSIGFAYAVADGGGDEQRSKNFEQTGLHSNRSRFTGTRSLLYRYNEALRPELSNLRILSTFVSVPLPRFDVSLVYHWIERNQDDEPIVADGIDLQPVNDDIDIGQGVDLVLATYFGTTPEARLDEQDDLRSNVRLRGSLFRPGDAYGDELDDQYRVMLETTLWF